MGSFSIKKNPDKVMILGTGDGWQKAPQRSDAIIYCLNDYVKMETYGVKPDLLFIMDVLDEKPQIVSGKDNLGEIVARINAMKVPLIAPFRYEDIPLSQAFPLKECVELLGTPYFSNTIAYMIAFAIMARAKEIDIYGVNQASSSEYFHEKAGVEYWVGMAIGRGIEVRIHGNKSQLLKSKPQFGGELLYGYNQTFQEIMMLGQKFGEPIVKKLGVKPTPITKKAPITKESTKKEKRQTK